MIIVKVRDGNIEKALKQLKRKVMKVKQIEQLRNKKEFTKKSISKRIQLKNAIYKQQKNSEN